MVRRKLFPLTSAKWVDDVTWRGNYVIIFEWWLSWISHKHPKTVKIEYQKLIETITKKTGKFWLKMHEIKISKNMPVEIRFPWKRQTACTKICHTKLLPGKFQEKSPSLVAFASIFKKLLTFKCQGGHFLPSPAPWPNRVNTKPKITEIQSITQRWHKFFHSFQEAKILLIFACSPFFFNSLAKKKNKKQKQQKKKTLKLKGHSEQEIRTRTARKIGTRQDGSASPSLFSCNHHFLRTRLFAVKYLTDLKRKGGLQAV